MKDKNVPPSVGEFAVGERDQLLARVAELEATAERLRLNIAEYNEHERCYQAEIAALKQPSAGVDEWVPIDKRLPELSGLVLVYRPDAHKNPACDANVTIKPYSATLGFGGSHEVTHWMPLPAHPNGQSSACVDREQGELSRAVDWLDDFVARCNGDDRGACESVNVIRRALQARAQLAAPAGVPDGWQLVPQNPAKHLDMGWAYIDAASENEPGRNWAFSHAGYRAMLAAAPSTAPASDVVPVPRELLSELCDLAFDAAEHHRQAMGQYKKHRQAAIDSIVADGRALLNGGRV